jgi:hypothetical protein
MEKSTCINCKKTPGELKEYVEEAKDLGITPDLYVQFNEGTYNFDKNIFACTSCYVEMGMPVGVAGNFKRGSFR